ncbi:hypothetical protein ACMA1I_19290 [Pontibacter sp. 13R65]|uniref:hypothetical protein n=1 Tax=Pontibacter sp. 13R65 TaxID=3127458 RepID=UPI00301DBA87
MTQEPAIELVETTLQATLFTSISLQNPEEAAALQERFHSSIFSVRETGIAPKRFHDWHRAGLLPFSIPEGKKNLLSFPDFIWVRMIDRLRSLGCPLGYIRPLKKYLFKEMDVASFLSSGNTEVIAIIRQVVEDLQLPEEQREEILDELEAEHPFAHLSGTAMPLLEMLLLYQLMIPDETGVIIFPTGTFKLWSEASGEERPNQTHLYLSMTEEVAAFRINSTIHKKVQDLDLPTPQEWEVLRAIRDKKAKEVTILFVDKGGERHMDLVTKQEEELDVETMRQIVEVLKLRGHTNVNLKTNRGEVVLSERSKRRRLQ